MNSCGTITSSAKTKFWWRFLNASVLHRRRGSSGSLRFVRRILLTHGSAALPAICRYHRVVGLPSLRKRFVATPIHPPHFGNQPLTASSSQCRTRIESFSPPTKSRCTPILTVVRTNESNLDGSLLQTERA